MLSAEASLKSQLQTWSPLDTWVNQIALTPDGQILAAACIDRSIRLWNVASQSPLGALKGHNNSVRCLAVRSDGALLYSGADEGTIRVWDLNAATCLDTWAGHKGAVRVLALSPDGKLLASGGDDGTVRLWDVTEKKAMELCPTKHAKPVSSLTFTSGGKYLVSGDEMGQIAIWTYADGVLAPYTQLKGPLGAITGLCGLPEQDEVLASCTDKTVSRWSPAMRGIVGQAWGGHSESVQCVKFDSINGVAFSGGLDGKVRLWNVDTGKECTEAWMAVETGVETMAVCAEKGILVVAGTSEIVSWHYQVA